MFNRKLNVKHSMLIGLISLFILFLNATVSSASGKGHTHEDESTHKVEIPNKYQSMKNPYWANLDAIVTGNKIYKKNCIKCHGANGEGDGSQAKSLVMKPFNFSDSNHMSQMSDGYLYWRVEEGGKFPSFKSYMPAYKNVLTAKEVWQVLSYVHAISHKHLLSHVVGEDVEMTKNDHHEEEQGHGHQ